ncbi:MAG: hypothetical protein K2J85_00705 [Anaeroplasmataceae bacterium]|nr:hypothetical protein [Anaeroplasmataceae bacterium]
MYNGKTKLILKYFGFLTSQYDMIFKFQSFKDYHGFHGPIDTYSFYNKNGCFTLHNIVQKGEWMWCTSKKISDNQYELLENEVAQRDYLSKRYFFTSQWLKELSKVLQIEIKTKGTVFNIEVSEKV